MVAGLDVDKFAPRLSFFFGIGMNFYMEVRARGWYTKREAGAGVITPDDSFPFRSDCLTPPFFLHTHCTHI